MPEPYPCGCGYPDGPRCPVHEPMECHKGLAVRSNGDECPQCRRLRWLSVGNTYTPTRTRRLRRETTSLEGM